MSNDKYITKHRQSLIDIAIQVYGNAESVYLLCKDNGLNITDEVPAGSQLSVNSDLISNKDIVAFFSAQKPVTTYSDSAVWILKTGVWNDDGIWMDDKFWNDGTNEILIHN